MTTFHLNRQSRVDLKRRCQEANTRRHDEVPAHNAAQAAGQFGALQPIADRIAREEDVKQVHRVEPYGERFLYLIETPFEFPRFVIGTTDAECKDVCIRFRCGMEWGALTEWERLKEQRKEAV